jgi:hypothetical protein
MEKVLGTYDAFASGLPDGHERHLLKRFRSRDGASTSISGGRCGGLTDTSPASFLGQRGCIAPVAGLRLSVVSPSLAFPGSASAGAAGLANCATRSSTLSRRKRRRHATHDRLNTLKDRALRRSGKIQSG